MTGPRPARRHNRRQILAAGLVLPALGMARPAFCSPGHSRRLALYHTHTGEALDVVYREDDDYLTNALHRIDLFLRDFRTGESRPIDPQLLDQLHDIRTALGATSRYEIVSGYRSPRTNAMLRATSHGVARNSLHMQGRALDIRLSGVATKDLRSAALELQRGGVGFYPQSDFVHVDTGRFRSW